jgi:hypothetical protein
MSKQDEYRAYLQGSLHDGTRSDRHNTYRISQKGTGWLVKLKSILTDLGHKSWLYREGKKRDVSVLETTADFLDIDFDPDQLKTQEERIAYVRGYFDAEGGLPQKSQARFYVQFTQKDQEELSKVKSILEEAGIECGVVHNPSIRVDPDYWRFYVRAKSHEDFVQKVGSLHPRKQAILQNRMKR